MTDHALVVSRLHNSLV